MWQVSLFEFLCATCQLLASKSLSRSHVSLCHFCFTSFPSGHEANLFPQAICSTIRFIFVTISLRLPCENRERRLVDHVLFEPMILGPSTMFVYTPYPSHISP